ncbi:MAG: deoxyribodipyrimidine photolyase, partial [Acidimicrobiia bacterium]|nr:deoxyribodipyrimidine photolyase [Acidimicrobiia bacterium]
MKSTVPEERISTLVDRPPTGDYVLYWMTGYRRLRSNFALQRAADWSRHLKLPLVVFVALRSDYPWANDRIHAFAIDGIADVVAGCAGRVACVAYVEPEPAASKGLLKRLTRDAAVMVGDDAPIFFLPAARQAAV